MKLYSADQERRDVVDGAYGRHGRGERP